MPSLDNLRKKKDVHCPECEKEQKHVKMMESDGKTMECPECHFLMRVRR